MRIPLVARARRHGLGQSFLVLACAALRRVADFEILRVETLTGVAPEPDPPAGYSAREVGADEYARKAKDLPGTDHERLWAFDRGDRCFANFSGDTLVGYTFYSALPTRVRPGLHFKFPEGLLYLYASYTHPDHRGKRLAAARSRARRIADVHPGRDPRSVVWYIAIDNSESRASSRLWHPELMGYLGYVRLGGRYYRFATAGCRRSGVELVAQEDSSGEALSTSEG